MNDDDGRVATAKLPDDLIVRLEKVAKRIDRSKNWVVRAALTDWLADEERRHELTLEALKDVDRGDMIDQSEMRDFGKRLKAP